MYEADSTLAEKYLSPVIGQAGLMADCVWWPILTVGKLAPYHFSQLGERAATEHLA